MTATDLIHGPERLSTACFRSGRSPRADESLPAAREAVSTGARCRSELIASGTGAHEIAAAEHYLPVPAPPLPILTPLLSVAPGQLLAWALAQARGLDPDTPSGMTKITIVP